MELSSKSRHILIIDGNQEHIQTIQTTLQKSDLDCSVEAIAKGEEAIQYLYKQGNFTDVPRPDLILLDVNLAATLSGAMDGLQILKTVKSEESLKRIPIIVLTQSDDKHTIISSYTLQGNCYVLKSSDLNQLESIVKRINEFWLGIVTLPIE